MSTISAIKQQAKCPERFSIFIDGTFQLSLSALDLSNSGIVCGQSLNDQDIVLLKAKANYGKALQAAYTLLSYRSRSRHELAQRLSRKGFDEATVEAVISRLIDLRLIDDQAFVSALLSRSSSKSLRRMQQELKQKGIDDDDSRNQLSANPDHDNEAIKVVITKRLNKSTPEKRKLIEYLARQGFHYNQIQRILAEDFNEIDWQQSSGRPLQMTTTTTRSKPYNSLR